MFEQDHIWVGQGEVPCNLLLNQANRHGLIAGASGTGKTVTLKVLAEGFSKAGVPVFMADVKGDVTGIAQAGDDTENITKRVEKFGIEDWQLEGCPTRLWDMLDDQGIPVRITISDMGPIMLSRLLELTEVQEGVLNIAFRVADDQQMLLIDLKDLRAMLNYVSEHSKEIETTYGKVSSQSVGAILRALIAIEDQGGDIFFGEPNLDLDDWFATDENGQGYVNVLNAARLINSPQIYAMFLLWMLSELFETLPEVGDADKPKFVFFFDEAHLLFNGMPKELLDKIVQVVKLIRSKGVGVYFITQSPSDIPDEVLAQLSNRIQHGLRAYTPAEQKAVKAAAQSFRENPAFNAKDKILELGTGEALVSFLDEEGKPSIVEYAKILPPQCRMAAADPANCSAQAKAACRLMRREYLGLYETYNRPCNPYFRDMLIKSYTYKGPVLEWYMRVKVRLERSYELFDRIVPREGTVVDLGCGYGPLSYMLAMLSDRRRIVGVDYDAEKIETARHSFLRRPETEFVHADLRTAELPEADAFLLLDVLHYMQPEEQRGLIERCAARLKAGGRIIIRDGDAGKAERHKTTAMTEVWSTKIVGFNKTDGELHFTSTPELQQTARRLGLEIHAAHTDAHTSNTVYILTRPE